MNCWHFPQKQNIHLKSKWISQTSLHLAVAMCLNSGQWLIVGSNVNSFRSVLKGSKQTSTEQRSNKIQGAWLLTLWKATSSQNLLWLHERGNKSLFKPLLCRVFGHFQLSLILNSTCYGLHLSLKNHMVKPNSQNDSIWNWNLLEKNKVKWSHKG